MHLIGDVFAAFVAVLKVLVNSGKCQSNLVFFSFFLGACSILSCAHITFPRLQRNLKENGIC